MANITFSYGSGINDSIFGKVQAPIQSFIERRGEAWEQKSLIGSIFASTKSKHFGEQYGSMTAMDGFQPVGENGKHPVDGNRESYKKYLENETWKNSFSISREAMDDAVVVNLKKRPEAFIAAYYRTRELYAAAVLGAAVKGLTTCDFRGRKYDVTAADGKKFFATDHPSILGRKAQGNMFKDAFSTKALGAVETKMQGVMDDNGDILDISPDTIIIPNDYALKNEVFEAIGSDKDPDTSNNGFNYHYGRWNVIVHPYLNQFITEGTKPWILLDSSANERYLGAIWQDRVPLEVESKIDSDTNANQWLGYARFVAGFNDWRPFAIGGMSSGTQLITV